MSLADEIRQARGDQSQQVFAVGAGIAVSTLARLERDGEEANPTVGILEAIAKQAGKRLIVRFADRTLTPPARKKTKAKR